MFRNRNHGNGKDALVIRWKSFCGVGPVHTRTWWKKYINWRKRNMNCKITWVLGQAPLVFLLTEWLVGTFSYCRAAQLSPPPGHWRWRRRWREGGWLQRLPKVYGVGSGTRQSGCCGLGSESLEGAKVDCCSVRARTCFVYTTNCKQNGMRWLRVLCGTNMEKHVKKFH